jgi:hypothetical protein
MTENSPEHNYSSAKIYGQSGVLKDLLKKIEDSKITTLEDVLQFRKDYANARRKMVADSIAEIKLQISKMVTELHRLKYERDEAIKIKSEEQNQAIARLEGELTNPHQWRNFFTAFYFRIKRWAKENKIKKYRKKSQKHPGVKLNYVA